MKNILTSFLETVNRTIKNLSEDDVKEFTQKHIHDRFNGRSQNVSRDDLDTETESDSFKGSGYNGKGKVNTSARTFNRSRKDIPRGREH